MAGLVPAIHVFGSCRKDVDARHKAGHDDYELACLEAQRVSAATVAAHFLVAASSAS
jgi:hypothetical protein